MKMSFITLLKKPWASIMCENAARRGNHPEWVVSIAECYKRNYGVSRMLSWCFDWSRSPQGERYWQYIAQNEL